MIKNWYWLAGSQKRPKKSFNGIEGIKEIGICFVPNLARNSAPCWTWIGFKAYATDAYFLRLLPYVAETFC